MTILVIVVILTILISANCSLYEAVLYSTRIATLESAKAKAKLSRVARLFLDMKRHISTPIAAVLILNTVANTAGATIAGMYAARVLGAANMPLFSIGLTLAILFIAEIIPKTLGALHWRIFWPWITYPLQFIKYVLYPAIFLTEKFTYFLTKSKKSATVTEDEILALVHLGAREGEISQEESRLVRNIINLEEKKVREIMTPRTVIFSLDANLTAEEAMKTAGEKGLTRIPIWEEDPENFIGYVITHDLSSYISSGQSATQLKAIARPIHFVPETVNCLVLLMNFLKHKRHIAIVVDEYGGVDGLVTLEDLIETMLGTEIIDETDQVVDLQEIARKRKPRNRRKGKKR